MKNQRNLLFSMFSCGGDGDTDSYVDYMNSYRYLLEGEYLLAGNVNDTSGINGGERSGFSNNISWTTDRKNRGNSAAYFSGIDSYIDLMECYIYYTYGNESYSCSLWVKVPSESVGESTIISDYESEMVDNQYWLDISLDSSNKIVWKANYSGIEYSLVSENSYNDNTWYLITFVVDVNLDRQFLYINSELIRTQLIEDGIDAPGTEGRVRLGAKKRGNALTEYFNGSLDDLRFYRKALNEDEIKELLLLN